jgi:4-oxalomesaconate tautomerase
MRGSVIEAVRCMLMRGGTSKGAYFLAEDLPTDNDERDALLLRMLGSPDPRQIDGIGGGHPLTSKVAVVSPATRPDADVDYLFLQVVVDRAEVSAQQNCGNLLAGVGPFAIERGLASAERSHAEVRIHMVNSGSVATARFPMVDGRVCYDGDTAIDGVPGTAAGISIAFADTAGSTCGALLPSGNLVDEIDGVAVTCIDNGMPVVIARAADLGIAGTEAPDELEDDGALAARVARLRAGAGKLMGFDDVTELTVPKVTLVSEATAGGAVSTRTFIPVRCHTSIGVLGAVTVATAAKIPGTVAHEVSSPDGDTVRIEHPTGFFDCEIVTASDEAVSVARSAVIRTARKLFDGTVFPGPVRTGGAQ